MVRGVGCGQSVIEATARRPAVALVAPACHASSSRTADPESRTRRGRRGAVYSRAFGP
jgi:hypothetical protein